MIGVRLYGGTIGSDAPIWVRADLLVGQRESTMAWRPGAGSMYES
jgi:hypothetical protein